MSQRTIYTCDNCGAEGNDRVEFEEIKITRRWRVDEPFDLYWGCSGDITITQMLLCKKCLETHLGMFLTSPIVIKETPKGFLRKFLALCKSKDAHRCP